MGGGSMGLVYALFACGLFLALLGASTLFLYVVARMRGETRVRVVSVSRRDDAA
jgi:hypothetical protein